MQPPPGPDSATQHDDVDPQLRIFMQRLAQGYAAHPPLAGLPLEQVRRITASVRAPWGEGGPRMAAREDLDTDGVRHGTVVTVLDNPASDLLELDSGRLVPLTFVVSHEPGRVVVDVPPGRLTAHD